MIGASDEEQLLRAQRESRVLFTQDDDFLRLAAQGRPHAGIVYARQPTAVCEIIYGLMLIYQILSSEEMRDHIEFF